MNEQATYISSSSESKMKVKIKSTRIKILKIRNISTVSSIFFSWFKLSLEIQQLMWRSLKFHYNSEIFF